MALYQSPAFVIQCKTCHVILGDSCWFVLASTDPSFICLDVVSSFIQVSDLAEACPEKLSFFKKLKCCSCASVVGRLYTSTTREMDKFRDLYCLDPDQVKTYVLGTGTEGGPTSNIDSEECLSGCDQPNTTTTISELRTCCKQLGLCYEQLVQRVKSLEDEIEEIRREKSDSD